MQRAERLRAAREKAGYPTAEAAADAMGVPRPTYHHHENGNRGFARHADRYARFFRVRIAWLMTGEPPMKAAEAVGAVEIVGSVGAGALVAAEIVRPAAAAGIRPGADRPAEGEAGWPEGAWAEIPGGAQAQAFVVRGDSQWPRFLDGELVLIAREPSPPDELVGQVCLVEIAAAARAGRPAAAPVRMIRMLRRSAQGEGRFRLESHNAPPVDDVEVRAAWRFLGLLPAAQAPAQPNPRRPAGRAR